jgi:hypothetical protein
LYLSDTTPSNPQKHDMFTNRFSIPVTLALASSLICIATAHEVKPLSKEIAAEDKLDTEFFKKSTMVQDIMIATSSKVAGSGE